MGRRVNERDRPRDTRRDGETETEREREGGREITGIRGEREAERQTNTETKGFRNRHTHTHQRHSHRWIHSDVQRNIVAKAQREGERERDIPRPTQTHREDTARHAEMQRMDGDTEGRKQTLGDW